MSEINYVTKNCTVCGENYTSVGIAAHYHLSHPQTHLGKQIEYAIRHSKLEKIGDRKK